MNFLVTLDIRIGGVFYFASSFIKFHRLYCTLFVVTISIFLNFCVASIYVVWHILIASASHFVASASSSSVIITLLYSGQFIKFFFFLVTI